MVSHYTKITKQEILTACNLTNARDHTKTCMLTI